jgi:tetratricopeptide (TPR) repeat protein
MRFYEKFAEVENSQRAWLELAKSYRKGKLFDKSEAIYQRVLAEDPTNKEARIGIAQIRYALQNEEYQQILDELHKEDPEWLCEWLKEEFNFRIYTNEKTMLSPNQAAKFLGYERIFDLTQRAFKNELPSHFNPGRARLTFYKEELANWANTLNRYNCSGEEIKLYPDRINEADVDIEEEESETAKKPAKAANTKVEDILRMIRERKAQRLKEQAMAAEAEAVAAANEDEPAAPAAKPKRGRTGKKK